MMRSSLLAVAALVLLATPATAQDPRIAAHINFGFQSQDQNFSQSVDFPLYEETGNWTAEHALKGATFVDVGGAVRVLRRFSLGASYTSRSKHSRNVTVNASVPSPIFTDTFRAASGSADGLEHTEKAVHLQALWHLPVTVEFDVTLFGGPTFFRVEDDLIAGIDLAEVGGNFSTVDLRGISTARQRNSATGFNVGIDTRYRLVRYAGVGVGVGAMLRYSQGSIDLSAPPGAGSAPGKLDTGGLEIGAGLRFMF